jgi:hypothetical protein
MKSRSSKRREAHTDTHSNTHTHTCTHTHTHTHTHAVPGKRSRSPRHPERYTPHSRWRAPCKKSQKLSNVSVPLCLRCIKSLQNRRLRICAKILKRQCPGICNTYICPGICNTYRVNVEQTFENLCPRGLASMREMHWRLSRKSTCCQSMPW